MTETGAPFAPRGDKRAVETGTRLSPKFDAAGLVTCVAADADTGDVVMVAHMNAEALARTLETGIAHYWSRSRQELWRKGETSGSLQHVVEARIDCDQDAVVLKVRVAGSGASCHLGYRSCFFRTIPVGAPPTPETELGFAEDAPRFDPDAVYGETPDE